MDHSSHMLTVATRDLFNELDKTAKPVAPMQFWMVWALILLTVVYFHVILLWPSFLTDFVEYSLHLCSVVGTHTYRKTEQECKLSSELIQFFRKKIAS